MIGKALRLLALWAVFLTITSCDGVSPGTVSFTLEWEQEPEGTVYIWVQVEERETPTRPGAILSSAPPVGYAHGDPFSVKLEGVDNGDNRYVVVEVREEANSG